ncbi:MAG: hypothetical protein Q9167_006969 [Letrouitia subvulpina]
MSPPSAIAVEAITDTQAASFVERLSINGVAARRSKAPAVSTGIVAHASSDMFKSPGYGKPKAKTWDHRLTEESKSRKSSPLKSAAKYLKTPGLINLGGGLPSSQYFPFEHIAAKVPKPPDFSESATKDNGISVKAGKHDAAEGKSIYGSTSALDMGLRMFATRGDYILTEEYAFCSALETIAPMGVKCLGVKMDDEGLLPSSMDSILANWNEEQRGAKKPFLLYTVPTGQNPTGATQSEQRRKDLYHCAQKHDLYILEDEPYYFLQMQPYTGPNAPDVPLPSSHEEFLSALAPSLLSMDVDGRVMRMDSLSKTIAPGTRTGWITASAQVVERFVRHTETSTQFPSGLSQLVLYKLLDETWGHAGYLDWLINLRLEYTKRRDSLVYACEEYLPKEVASWRAPAAGMFHWIKIDWRRHPLANTISMLEIEEEIYHAGIDRGVLYCRGSWFRAEADSGEGMFFRTTFATSSAEDMAEAIKRFGEALRAIFDLKNEVNGHA